jgi:hypothetical protein
VARNAGNAHRNAFARSGWGVAKAPYLFHEPHRGVPGGSTNQSRCAWLGSGACSVPILGIPISVADIATLVRAACSRRRGTDRRDRPSAPLGCWSYIPERTRLIPAQPFTGSIELKGLAAELLIDQRGALIATTRMLEAQARLNEQTRSWYTIATTICAHAAAGGDT